MNHSSGWPTYDIETVIEKYSDMLYRLCIIMLKNESDAEDAVQETFIKYLQKSPIFQNPEHEKAWLITVATNQCRDLLRFRTKHPEISDNEWTNIRDTSTDSGILDALTSLPEKYRLVLTLHYIEGYGTNEIAKIINRTSSAVKMRLQKGRKLLEKIYREEYL